MAVLLITGGTGSLGQGLCSALAKSSGRVLGTEIEKVVVVSRNESAQYSLQQSFPDLVDCVIGDVRDAEVMVRTTKGVDLVVHAAAIKHIDVAERNPEEAIKTNVTGSLNVARACSINEVQAVLSISTDKACVPNSAYGTTKLLAEKIFTRSNSLGTTRFASARFGNLLGSSGSVLLRWLKDASSGLPITVTHPDMTRYFFGLDQAADLVLHSLIRLRGGEVFVPKMSSFRIQDIARLIQPEGEFHFMGLRLGEKLHEDLISDSEVDFTVEQRDLLIVEPHAPLWEYQGYEGGKLSEGISSNKSFLGDGRYSLSFDGMSRHIADLRGLLGLD